MNWISKSSLGYVTDIKIWFGYVSLKSDWSYVFDLEKHYILILD